MTPGFIDMHTHSDLQPLVDPLYECKLYQGVTTDVIGHDGLGLAPARPDTAEILREQLAAWNGLPDIERDWTTISTYLDRFEESSGGQCRDLRAAGHGADGGDRHGEPRADARRNGSHEGASSINPCVKAPSACPPA